MNTWSSAGGAAASSRCLFTVSNMAYQSNSKKSHPRSRILPHSDRWTHHKHLFTLLPVTYSFSTRERTLEPCQVQRHQKFLHLRPRPLFVSHASSCYLIPIFRRKREALQRKKQMFWTSSAGFSTGRPVVFGQDWRPVLHVTSCASRVLPLGLFLPPPTEKKMVNEHVPPGRSSTARCSVRKRLRWKKCVCVFA